MSGKVPYCSLHAIAAEYSDTYESDNSETTLGSQPTMYVSPSGSPTRSYQYGTNEEQEEEQMLNALKQKLKNRGAQSKKSTYEYTGKLFPRDEDDAFNDRVAKMMERLKTPLKVDGLDKPLDDSSSVRKNLVEEDLNFSENSRTPSKFNGFDTPKRNVEPEKKDYRKPVPKEYFCPVCDVNLGDSFEDEASSHVLTCLEERERIKRERNRAKSQTNSVRQDSFNPEPERITTNAERVRQRNTTSVRNTPEKSRHQEERIKIESTPEKPTENKPKRTPVKAVKVVNPKVYQYESPDRSGSNKRTATRMTSAHYALYFLIFVSTIYIVLKILG
jgi:hypothetical protein